MSEAAAQIEHMFIQPHISLSHLQKRQSVQRVPFGECIALSFWEGHRLGRDDA